MDEISREAAARMCRDALRAERRDNPRGSAEIEQPPPIHETVMLSDPGRCAGEQPLIRRRNSRGVANEKLDIHQFLGGPRAEKVAKSRPVSCGGVQLYEVRLALAGSCVGTDRQAGG